MSQTHRGVSAPVRPGSAARVPQQRAPHDARCSHHSLVDQTGAEACRCAQRGIVRSSRPPLVGHTRSARWPWPFTALLFGPVVRPGAIIDSSSGRDRARARDDAVPALCLLHARRHSTRFLRRRRPATPFATGARPGAHWHSQPAAALATPVAGRRCLAAICRRDDAQRVHFAGKRQPTQRCCKNSNLFSAHPLWEASHSLGRRRPWCPP